MKSNKKISKNKKILLKQKLKKEIKEELKDIIKENNIKDIKTFSKDIKNFLIYSS